MKQKKVTLTEDSLKTEYETKNLKVTHFEKLTRQRLYFSRICDPNKWPADPLKP